MTDETENDSTEESNATNGGMVEKANRTNATNEVANNSTEASNGADNGAVNEENNADAESDTNREDDEMPGFGILIALLTFSIIILTRRRR